MIPYGGKVMRWLRSLLDRFVDDPRFTRLNCAHPEYARDYRLNLLPEEEGWEAYEACLLCGTEWHDNGK